jgi:hypothetical protein
MAMHKRCYYERDKSYINYGARGIKVCDRWFDFQNYLDDMGERPLGMFLERIDNDGNYEPSNCKWATRKEQNYNKRSTKFVSLDGEIVVLAEAARRLNQEYYAFHHRMAKHNFAGDARNYCVRGAA